MIADNIFSPRLIQANFLDNQEVQDILAKIDSLNEHWKLLHPYSTDSVRTRMLPIGFYVTHTNMTAQEYSTQVSSVYRDFMYRNFSELYEKLKQKLESYLQLELFYSLKLNYPGFHIWTIDDPNIEEGEYSYYNIHRDRFQALASFIEYDKIYSVVVPLEVPESQASLFYTLEQRVIPRNSLNDLTVYHTYPYLVGDMSIWSGELLHSINPFKLKKNERRITLQMHIAVSGNTGTIFW